MAFLEGDDVTDPYFERNNTQRVTTRAGYTQLYDNGNSCLLYTSPSPRD